MRKLIYIVIAVIIIFICIVARCDTYDKAKRQYYKLENEFNSVSEALLVLPTEYLYIDVENKESVEKEILNWGYSIPISEINILLDAGVDGIMKNGAAVMYKLGNKTNRAYGIAYFQYYFSTQEPKYELITAVNAIEEKTKTGIIMKIDNEQSGINLAFIDTYEYDAFGNETLENEKSEYNPFRYNGQYYDEETGFIYLRNRYYDPSTGRFTSEDPVKDGFNWYVYCANNPIGYEDINGLEGRLLGTFDEQLEMLSYVQTLTDDTIWMDSDGRLVIVDRADDSNLRFPAGTQLIRDIIGGEGTNNPFNVLTNIQFTTGVSRTESATDGKSYNAYLNKDEPHITEAWSYESNSIEQMETPIYIVLGHELIHAMDYITGAVSDSNSREMGINKVERPGGEIEYYAEEARELRAIGRVYYNIGDYQGTFDNNTVPDLNPDAQLKYPNLLYNENMLREEHFLGERYYHDQGILKAIIK